MDNHLFITLHDHRVTYRTTQGSQGGMPTTAWTHAEAIDYLKDLHQPTSMEIRDDRTPPPPPGNLAKRIVREALEIIGACVIFSAIFVIVLYFYFIY